jgi:hypothetical protein
MWGLWWTKRHWGRFSPSTSVSPANHSTDFSIIIITRGSHNRPLSGRSVEWTLVPPPTMQIKKKNKVKYTTAHCKHDVGHHLGGMCVHKCKCKSSFNSVTKQANYSNEEFCLHPCKYWWVFPLIYEGQKLFIFGVGGALKFCWQWDLNILELSRWHFLFALF